MNTFTIENDRLTIKDDEIDLLIDIPFNPIKIPKKGKDGDLVNGNTLHIIENNDLNIKESYFEKEDLVEGQFLQFDFKNKKISETYYKNGKLHGPSRFWSNKGKLIATSCFIEGEKQGNAVAYYKNGNLFSIQHFKDGILEGMQKYYYENKVLKSLLPYKNGQLDGTVKLYYKNQNLKREVIFENGKRMGHDRQWNPSGNLIEEGFYNGFKRFKHLKRWHPNGNLAQENIYHGSSAKLFDFKKLTEEGVLKEQGIFDPKTQIYVHSKFTQEGKLFISRKGYLKGDKLIFDNNEGLEES